MIDFTRLALALSPPRKQVSQLATEGTLLGTAECGQPVLLPLPTTEKAQHICCLAASGAGKTVLSAEVLISEYLQALRRDQANAQALVCLDPKSDLAVAVQSALAAQAPELLANVTVLNPFSERGFMYNLNRRGSGGNTNLDLQAQALAGLVAAVSTGVGSQRHLGVGQRQVDVISNVILGILSSDHREANLSWCVDACSTQTGQQHLAKLARHPRAKAFLEQMPLGEELRASTASRLRSAFCSTDQLTRLIAAPGCIDFNDLIAPGKILILDLGAPPLGQETLTVFYSNLLFHEIVNHLMARPSPWSGFHVRLVLDEAQVPAATLGTYCERLLTLGRSKGLSVALLSQGLTLLDAASPNLVRVMLGNCPQKLIGRLHPADAALLATEAAPKQGIEESLSAIRSRLVGSVCNLPDRGFTFWQPGSRVRLTSRPVDTAAWATAVEREQTQLRDALTRYALPPNQPPPVTLAEAARGPGRDDSQRRQRGPAPQPRSPWG